MVGSYFIGEEERESGKWRVEKFLFWAEEFRKKRAFFGGEVAKWSNATRLGRVPSGSGVRTPPSSRLLFFFIGWTW